jgi:outer membrane protein
MGSQFSAGPPFAEMRFVMKAANRSIASLALPGVAELHRPSSAARAADAPTAPLKIGRCLGAEPAWHARVGAADGLEEDQEEFAGRDQDLQKLAKQAKDMRTSLEKDRVAHVRLPTARPSQRDLAALTRDLRRKDRRGLREDFDRRNEELSGMLEQINKVIRKMAEAEKYKT